MNLVLAEWSRLFARRVTIATAIVIAGLLALIALGFALSSTQPTADDKAHAADVAFSAQQTWDATRRECLDVERGVIQARAGQKYPPNCDYGARPTADQFLSYGFTFHRQWPSLYYMASIILGLAGFVVGASFVGAEWTSGGMTNLLLWRPQRMAVLGAKLGVALTGVLAMSAVYLVAWTVAFLGVAASSGVIGEMTAGEWASFLLACVRVALLGVVGAAIGFALASIGRHTAMALGAGIAYLLVYELGTAIVFSLLGTQYPERFRLSTYVIAWLTKRYQVYDRSFTCNNIDCFSSGTYVITWAEGGLVLGVVAGALLGGAFLSMRRRDVA